MGSLPNDHAEMDSNAHTDAQGAAMPIAVLGLGFKGPGDANSVQGLLDMIREGRESWSEIPKEKWSHESFYHPDPNRMGTHNVKGGHFFKDDLSRFDAPFFNMTRDEATALDPQQRILLECSYEAMENAGIPIQKISGSDTSVFVGQFCGDYTDLLQRSPETMPMFQCTNSSLNRAITANRVSYFFNLQGPSVTVDTACSSSLVALHMACQSLRTGEAKCAIAAGVNVILSHEIMITMSMMRLLSPDGRCYTFDERANGYARGEGVGCVILKPLQEALNDGDHIRAVIRGTGTNQDGKTAGITLPNGAAQERLIGDVYKSVGLDPVETTYVEAHGTGTPTGDPIETGAISRAFCGERRPADKPLWIGSVKTNVGHLEGASGITGVIKTVLMLENKTILPNRNFVKVNRRIPLDDWKLKVPTRQEHWDVQGARRASVNSFGYGGSNAHAILEDAETYLAHRALVQSRAPRSPSLDTSHYLNGNGSNGILNGVPNGSLADNSGSHLSGKAIVKSTSNGLSHSTNGHNGHEPTESLPKLFVISSSDESSGKGQLERLVSYLETHNELPGDGFMRDLAYTLSERRTRLNWVTATCADSATNLVQSLKACKFSRQSKPATIGFVFTGQGAQWAGMGRDLIQAYPVFRSSIQKVARYMKAIGAPYDVEDVLLNNQDNGKVSLPLYSQPLCSAIQIALVELLRFFGITPSSVTGHSSGEIAAAYAAGILTFEDAIAVAYFRGVVSNKLQESQGEGGSMMAVGLSAASATSYISSLSTGKAVVACVNSPSSVTISGDTAAVEELRVLLEKDGIFARKLAVQVAYHSHHMKAVADEYFSAISHIQPRDSGTDSHGVRFYSSVSGNLATTANFGPDYWVANLLSQVKFSESVRELCLGSGIKKARSRTSGVAVNTLIELGPHSALAGPIKQIVQENSKTKDSVVYLPTIVRKQSAVDTTLAVVAKLAETGYNIDICAINGYERKNNFITDLPTYAWNHENSFWAESRVSKVFRNRDQPRNDLLGAIDGNSNHLEPAWRNHIRSSEIPWIKDHRVQSNIVYPAAGYLAMAIEAASQHAKTRSIENITGYCLREVTIGSALIISEQSEVETLVTFRPYSTSVRSPSDSWTEFVIYSVSEDNNWTEHCRGLVAVESATKVVDDVTTASQQCTVSQRTQELVHDAKNYCEREIDVHGFYEQLVDLGLEYGKTFANLSTARATRDLCIGEIIIPDTKAVMPENFEYPFVLHPSTLDSVFHPVFLALSDESAQLSEPAVPTFIGELYVSRKIASTPGHKLQVCTQVRKRNDRDFVSDLAVYDPSDASLDPCIEISRLTCNFLPRGQGDSDAIGSSRQLAYTLEWKPDVELLSPKQLTEILTQNGIPTKSSMTYAAEYIQLLGYKNPQQTILELSLEMSANSSGVLDLLENVKSKPPFSKWVYTKASRSELDEAKTRLQAWTNVVNLETLELGKDPSDQGFEKGSFDVIITASMLSDNISTSTMLQNLRTLLKPGGKLVMVGIGGEKTEDEFHNLLVQNHFSGVDIHLKSFTQESMNAESLVISGPVPSPSLSITLPDILLVVEESCSGVSLNHLTQLLEQQGAHVEISKFLDAEATGKFCVVLSELERPIIAEQTAASFEVTKNLLTRASGVLWVTCGASIAPSDPRYSVITGVTRTARSENDGTYIATLDLDAENPLSEAGAAELVHTLISKHFASGSTDSSEYEFAERGGILKIPRLIANEALQNSVSSTISPPLAEAQPFQQQGRPLHLTITPGLLDTLRWVDYTELDSALPDYYMEIEVKAMSLNFKDVMMGLGQINFEGLGLECSGVVSKVGRNVPGFAVGDRAVCYGFGTFASSFRDRATAFRRIPDDMSFELAAALPVIYCTAYYSVYELARVQKGDKVLIHAASGGLGQALIELCQMVGAEIFATVGTVAKKELLLQLSIPEDHIFFSRDHSFAKGIMRQTGGVGVDVIFNSLAGEALRLTWDCLAPFGRFVELGARDMTINSRLEMNKFLNNTSFMGFDFSFLVKQRSDIAGRVWSEVMNLFRSKTLKGPTPLDIRPVSDIKEALQLMQTGKHVGKLVLRADEDSMVEATPRDHSLNLLKSDASYLLVGGLGGIGRAIALWMVDHGARNLIFANRSGLKSKDAREFVEALQARGINAEVHGCDICKKDQLDQLLSISSKNFPSIKGVVQAAMVLRDGLFEKMSFEEYNDVLGPKYHGTWNLHTQLPKDMDFFVMLSSISGIIGNATQAAYAGGSTFQDAFARYRNSLGLPATTVDLGAIGGIGYLADNKELAKGMERQGFHLTDETTLLALIQYAISHPRGESSLSQLVTGLGVYKKGVSLASLDLPLFAHHRRYASDENTSEQAGGSANIRNSLRQAANLEEAASKVSEALLEKIASRSSLPVEAINIDKPITDYGIDSLVAVELRNWIAGTMDSTLPILELLANKPLEQLFTTIAQKSQLVKAS